MLSEMVEILILATSELRFEGSVSMLHRLE